MVNADAPSVNFGIDPLLGADASPVKHSFLRFRVSNVGTRAVASAHVQLQVSNAPSSGSPSGGRLHAITSCAWDELTITSASQPTIDGAVLGTAGAVTFNQLVDFDVGSVVHGDGVYCFALESGATDGVAYNSRESTGQAPTLLVTTAP